QSFEKLEPKNQGRHLRRINQQHRGVYIVDENLKQVEIYSAGRFVGLSGMAWGSMPGKRVTRAWLGVPCPANGLSGHGAGFHARQTDYPGMARGSMPGRRVIRAWRGTPCPANGLPGHGATIFTVIFENRCHCHKPG